MCDIVTGLVLCHVYALEVNYTQGVVYEGGRVRTKIACDRVRFVRNKT